MKTGWMGTSGGRYVVLRKRFVASRIHFLSFTCGAIAGIWIVAPERPVPYIETVLKGQNRKNGVQSAQARATQNFLQDPTQCHL